MPELFKSVLTDYRANWKLLSLAAAIVLVPVALLAAISGGAGTDALSAYSAVALFIMNTAVAALALAIVQQPKKLPTLSEVYYRRAPVVRALLLLINPLLWLTVLPFLLGLGLYGIVVSGAGLQFPEQILLILLAVIIASPSLFLTAWLSPVIFILNDTDLGPWQAVRASFKLVWKSTAKTVLRLFGLGLTLLGFMVPITVIFGLAVSYLHASWLLIALQIVLGTTLVPITNLWLARMYVQLKAAK